MNMDQANTTNTQVLLQHRQSSLVVMLAPGRLIVGRSRPNAAKTPINHQRLHSNKCGSISMAASTCCCTTICNWEQMTAQPRRCAVVMMLRQHTCAVMKLLLGCMRNSKAAAVSSGSPKRPSGIICVQVSSDCSMFQKHA
jgi:hypothetical protein